MRSKTIVKLGCWLLCGLIGWGLAWGTAVFAYEPRSTLIAPFLVNAPSTEALAEQALSAYREGRLWEAIALWESALQSPPINASRVEQAHIWNHIAMTYGLLGEWQKADAAIAQSLQRQRQSTQPEEQKIQAETFNIRGISALERGQSQQSIDYWQTAIKLYQSARYRVGEFRARVNQAKALQAMGLFPRACQQLLDTLQIPSLTCSSLDADTLALAFAREESPLASDRHQAWLTLARSLRQVGQIETSDYVLETLLVGFGENQQNGEVWLTLAENSGIVRDFDLALADWQQALRYPLRPQQRMKAQLAQFEIWIQQGNWAEVRSQLPQLWQSLQQLPINRVSLFAEINFLSQLLALSQTSIPPLPIPSAASLGERLQQVQQRAQSMGDRKGESYALGILSELYIQQQQWSQAQALTQEALVLAESLAAPELVYQWQWQLARIQVAQGNTSGAIVTYLRAIATLKPISGDLAANPEIQFSFQRQVEPLYRELLSLLLPQNNQETVNQSYLQQAKEQIESLQLVELNNFFREICLTRQSQSLETIDPHAAIIYPIILSDRLALLLSLPNQPLQVKIVPIASAVLESKVEELRRTVVIRSRRDYLPPAQQLYDWLIRPLHPQLQQVSNLKTLVFVMDGVLRNLPVAVLRDRQQFLIESYQLALTPGLTLLAPQPIQQTGLSTLLAGLSQSRSGLAPLQYVEAEFQKIQSLLAARLLLNKDFTEAQLRQVLSRDTFPIVHLATHGQFSSRFNDTFILTWDTELNIQDLESILQANELQNEGTIELLVLSACETAVGDRRAALGLAGVAVRSGARSTLATLWSVNDEGTAALIGQFYEQLSQKQATKAEALRQAQLTLLRNRWYQHPFYWSPFVLVGNWL